MREREWLIQLASGDSWRLVAGNNDAVPSQTLLARCMGLDLLPAGRRVERTIVIVSLRSRLSDSSPPPLSLLSQELRDEMPANGWQCSAWSWRPFWTHRAERISIVDSGPEPELGLPRLLEQVLRPIIQQVIRRGGALVHGALHERLGEAFILTGPSGIGKTTCSERLAEPWVALCDDILFLVPVGPGAYSAHPLPSSSRLWEDTRARWDFTQCPRVRGIAFLEQALVDELEPIPNGRAALLFNHSAQTFQIFFSNCDGVNGLDDEKERLFENVCQIVRDLPTFILRVSRNGRFWECLERVAQGDGFLARAEEQIGGAREGAF